MASIQGVYVALFGRPADPAGLAYFNSVTKNGADLSGIGDLASTSEYQTRFAGQSNVQIVNSIYQSLFNRPAEAAGLNFFVDALNKGTLNTKNIAIAILDGATGDDKIVVTNKLTAADNFTKAIDTAVEIGSYQGTAAANSGRAFLQNITKDTTTIPSASATDAAILAIQNSTPGSTGTAGVTINGVAAGAIIGPNNADPATKTTAGDDTINATGIDATSKIDASAGTDTLNIKLTGNTGSAFGVPTAATTGAAGVDVGGKPTLTGVEKVFVTFTGGQGGNGTGNAGESGGKGGNFNLDLSGSTGVKEVWNDTSVVGAVAASGTVKALGGDTVTFSNVALGTALGVKGDTTVDTVFSFTGNSGAADSASLNLKAASAGLTLAATKTVTMDGIETVNVAVDGTSKLKLSDTTLDKVVVTGTGNLEFVTASTTIKAVDASALNGGLINAANNGGLDVSSAANGVTVTGSKFADFITLNANGAGGVNASDKDVIVYSSANKSTAAVLDTIVNFTSGEDKLDVKAFGLSAPAAVTPLSAAPTNGTAVTTNIAVLHDANVSTTVYVDSDKSGTFDANDLVIKLAGNVDVKVSDFTFA